MFEIYESRPRSFLGDMVASVGEKISAERQVYQEDPELYRKTLWDYHKDLIPSAFAGGIGWLTLQSMLEGNFENPYATGSIMLGLAGLLESGAISNSHEQSRGGREWRQRRNVCAAGAITTLSLTPLFPLGLAALAATANSYTDHVAVKSRRDLRLR